MPEAVPLENAFIVTHATEPYIREPQARRSTVEQAERPVSILVQPEVVLHQTREGTARRHLVRGILRMLTMATGDAAAASLAAIVVAVLIARVPILGLGPIPHSSTLEYCGALLMALGLTGSYRRSAPHPSLTLLVGCTLGVLVVSWSSFWVSPSLAAIPGIVLLAVVTTCLLFLTRGTLAALGPWLLPEHRRLVPAIAVSAAPVPPDLPHSTGYRIAGRIALAGRHDESRAQELAQMIRQVRAESVVVFGALPERQFVRFLEISLNAGCEVLCTPPGYGAAEVRPSVIGRGPGALIQVQPPTLKAPQVVAKRFVDVVASLIAVTVTAPIWLLVALAIRIDSPGPVFFSQERVGLGGRRFRMLKFRTMRVGAHTEKIALQHLNQSGDPRVFKIPNDPRVSRVGGFLRRWSLDELPQFVNVIMGSMSLVGPRPVPEEDFIDYEDHHFRRLGAKPGITGLWQVNGRSSVSGFEERVRLDTEYIDRWSIWLDLKILLSTVPAVMRRTGAY